MKIEKICKDCHKKYYTTSEKDNWFINNNLKIPVRCPSCIKLKKDNPTLYREIYGHGMPGSPGMQYNAMNNPQYLKMYCVNGSNGDLNGSSVDSYITGVNRPRIKKDNINSPKQTGTKRITVHDLDKEFQENPIYSALPLRTIITSEGNPLAPGKGKRLSQFLRSENYRFSPCLLKLIDEIRKVPLKDKQAVLSKLEKRYKAIEPLDRKESMKYAETEKLSTYADLLKEEEKRKDAEEERRKALAAYKAPQKGPLYPNIYGKKHGAFYIDKYYPTEYKFYEIEEFYDYYRNFIWKYKNGTNIEHGTDLIKRALSDLIKNGIITGDVIVLATVPRSKTYRLQTLKKSIEAIVNDFREDGADYLECRGLLWKDGTSIFMRTRDVEEAHNSQKRDLNTYKIAQWNSIECTESDLSKNPIYVIMDDIVTSGTQLSVCEEKLRLKGVPEEKIIKLTLGGTTHL